MNKFSKVEIVEIIPNGVYEIYEEIDGKMVPTGLKFINRKQAVYYLNGYGIWSVK